MKLAARSRGHGVALGPPMFFAPSRMPASASADSRLKNAARAAACFVRSCSPAILKGYLDQSRQEGAKGFERVQAIHPQQADHSVA